MWDIAFLFFHIARFKGARISILRFYSKMQRRRPWLNPKKSVSKHRVKEHSTLVHTILNQGTAVCQYERNDRACAIYNCLSRFRTIPHSDDSYFRNKWVNIDRSRARRYRFDTLIGGYPLRCLLFYQSEFDMTHIRCRKFTENKIVGNSIQITPAARVEMEVWWSWNSRECLKPQERYESDAIKCIKYKKFPRC